MLTIADAERYVTITPSQLVRWRPARPSSGHRSLFLLPEVESDIRSRWARLPAERENGAYNRRYHMMSLLDDWVGGEVINLSKEIKPLEPRPDGIWEFRSTYSVGARLIGMVPGFNMFIAFGIYRRDALGPGMSAEWEVACRHAKAKWYQFFGDERPLPCPSVLTTESAREFWDDRRPV
jgi:hypothetical protein